MSVETLLDKTRRLNKLLQQCVSEVIVFEDLCKVFGLILGSDVLLISKKGKILSRVSKDNDALKQKIESVEFRLSEKMKAITETRENLSLCDFEIDDTNFENIKIMIVPINTLGGLKGNLIIYRNNQVFLPEDIIIGEYVATIIGLELCRSEAEEMTEIQRKNALVKSAVSTLSYSELEAVLGVFSELSQNDGLIIASKIADRMGITRSVIVNALRKLESAGLIETRSLGMKGTYIRILNSLLKEELGKLKK